MTKIFLIRHGETVWNVERIIQGHLDSPLTEKGITQIEALANHLKSQKFDALYSSDLGRAYQTAKCISKTTGLSIVTDKRLRERNLGIFQGIAKKVLKTKFPEESRFYEANDANYVIPEGESIKQLSKRCITYFEELLQKHAGQHILVTTHNGVLVTLLKHTMQLPLEVRPRFISKNSSINVFTYENNTWLLERLGDLSHLQHD
ncbi:histidine phosphatase family protein [Candidatus Parabeggiatoa sp. HSG14]|uniref:histidine phosphatase family protein n=1 Tax=Candidatus Parabeggiatoa sp. HSG14 TaxID=3055593 RepID=UPI0025A76D75|nr:histidine phosphatase family protein [Thiotrichales bacterium HSG14]